MCQWLSPLQAFFLWAAGVKLRFCTMRMGVEETPSSIGEMPQVLQEKGKGCSATRGLTPLNSDTSTSWRIIHPQTRTYTQIHKFPPSLQCCHTPFPPWSQCPCWSRFLDDIVKQLHGLHDVLILDTDKRFQLVPCHFFSMGNQWCKSKQQNFMSTEKYRLYFETISFSEQRILQSEQTAVDHLFSPKSLTLMLKSVPTVAQQ